MLARRLMGFIKQKRVIMSHFKKKVLKLDFPRLFIPKCLKKPHIRNIPQKCLFVECPALYNEIHLPVCGHGARQAV